MPVITVCAICGDAIRLSEAPRRDAYCTECIENAIKAEKARVVAMRRKELPRREDVN